MSRSGIPEVGCRIFYTAKYTKCRMEWLIMEPKWCTMPPGEKQASEFCSEQTDGTIIYMTGTECLQRTV